jgi:hypothetical protein
MAQPRLRNWWWIGVLGGILVLSCGGCLLFSVFWSASPAGRAAGVERTATAAAEANLVAATATAGQATVLAQAAATQTAWATDLPQVSTPVALGGFNSWVVTVTQLGWTTSLWDPAAQVVREAGWRWSLPQPRYWLLWVDALHTGNQTAALGNDYAWHVRWSVQDTDYAWDSSAAYVLPEGRASPAAWVAPDALTPELLVFEGGSQPPVALEIHYNTRGAPLLATVNLLGVPRVVHLPDVHGLPATALPTQPPNQ